LDSYTSDLDQKKASDINLATIVFTSSLFVHHGVYGQQALKNEAFKNSAECIHSFFSFATEKKSNCLLMINTPGSPDDILNKIEKHIVNISQRNSKEDSQITDFLFYFIGHGDGEGTDYSLVLRDTREGSGFSLSSLRFIDLVARTKEVFHKINLDVRQFYVVDACYSGRVRFATKNTSGYKSRKGVEKYPRKGVAVISSCNEQELSTTPNGSGKTLFSDSFHAALAPRNATKQTRKKTDIVNRLTLNELRVRINALQSSNISVSNSPPTPLVHIIDSIDGDLQDFPLFPDESAVIGSSRHILYVEDDKWYARDRILQLEESGYTVKYVRTAKLAVSAWNRVNFDVVILDIRMPHPINISGIDPGDSTGVWVLEQIAKKVIDSRAVIWILTNRTDLNTVIDELESRVPELIGRFHVDPKNDIELRYFSATLGEILRRSFD